MIDFKNGALFKLKRDKNAKVGQVEDLLIEGETVIGSYTAVRDYVVFTNKRIIAVNVQGITGKKQDYSSLPYSKVQAFCIGKRSCCSSGTFIVFQYPAGNGLFIFGNTRFQIFFSYRKNMRRIQHFSIS